MYKPQNHGYNRAWPPNNAWPSKNGAVYSIGMPYVRCRFQANKHVICALRWGYLWTPLELTGDSCPFATIRTGNPALWRARIGVNMGKCGIQWVACFPSGYRLLKVGYSHASRRRLFCPVSEIMCLVARSSLLLPLNHPSPSLNTELKKDEIGVFQVLVVSYADVCAGHEYLFK